MTEWAGEERRHLNKQGIRQDILNEIVKTKDDNLRAILTLMFSSLEYTDSAVHRIEAKIDALRNDEVAIRKLVLNGHVQNHHDHHDWLESRIKDDLYYKDIISRAMPVIEQYEKRLANSNGLCEFAASELKKREEHSKDKKEVFLSFFKGLFGHFGTAAATLLLAYIMWGTN